MNLHDLKKPFPVSEIQWRIGSTTERDGKVYGLALAYYDARALYDCLDNVCGPENWQIRYPHANGKTCAEIGIRINNEWVFKANGAGDSDVEAEKGAFSDAAKRAGVPWGIGRYLYEIGDTWVECEKRGKSTVIKKTEKPKLNKAYEDFLKTGVKAALVAPDEAPKPSPETKAETKPEAKPELTPELIWKGKQNAISAQLKKLVTAQEITNWTRENLGKMKALEVDQLNWVNDQINQAQDRVAVRKVPETTNYLQA